MTKQRVEWVDTMRGLGILCVVYGHQQIEPTPSKWLQLTMVPLFFFASGLVFSPGKYARYIEFFRRRFRGLVVPYFFYSLVSWGFWVTIWAYSFFALDVPRPGLIVVSVLGLVGIPYGAGAGKFLMTYNPPLWFLTCLFCADSMFYLLQRRVKSAGALLGWMTLLSLVGFAIGKVLPIPLPWNADTAATVMIYYGAGYLFRQRFGLQFNFAWWIKIILAAAFLAISAVISTYNPQTHLMDNEIGRWPLFHLASIASLVFFVMMAQLLAPTWIIGYFGRNTLPLLGLHVLMMSVFRYIAAVAFGIEFKQVPHTTLWALFWGTGTLLLIVPFIFLFNRYVPWAVGKPPGKKKKIVTAQPAAPAGA